MDIIFDSCQLRAALLVAGHRSLIPAKCIAVSPEFVYLANPILP